MNKSEKEMNEAIGWIFIAIILAGLAIFLYL